MTTKMFDLLQAKGNPVAAKYLTPIQRALAEYDRQEELRKQAEAKRQREQQIVQTRRQRDVAVAEMVQARRQNRKARAAKTAFLDAVLSLRDLGSR